MSEFWPKDKWDPCYIPYPGLIRKIACYFKGHKWATNYWVGQGEPNWPNYEYCENCWKHRDMIRAEDLGEKILSHDLSGQN